MTRSELQLTPRIARDEKIVTRGCWKNILYWGGTGAKMRRADSFFTTLVLILVILVPTSAHAQLWTGIIAPSRAADWSTVGVVGDIPSGSWANCATTACNTLFGGTVTATSIQNALASCPANTVVRIPAGTFSVGAFNDTKSNCVLRGAGANQTILNFTGCNSGGGLGGTNCASIHLMSGATGAGAFGGFTSANWTAGYTQGTTVITLSNTSGLIAGPVGTGSLIMLDQADDVSDGWPATGDIFSCATVANNCSNKGGNNYARPGRAQVQVVTVTAISGNQITITPGLAYPNWRTTQAPGAYWNSGSPLGNAGIENLTVDFTGNGGQGVYIMNCANCWLLGTREIINASGTAETYHIFTFQSAHLTIRSNYIYGRPGDSCASFPLANYAYSDQEVSDTLVENNIGDSNVDFIIPNDPAGRNVFAYNYVINGVVGVAGSQMHSGNHMMSLWEGNNIATFMGDVTHGTHFFITLYRNHFDGSARNNSCTTGFAMGALTNNRFFNFVANVAGSSGYSQYEGTLGSAGGNEIFDLGWMGNNSGTPVTNDTNVKRTLLRWGNWDMFTSSNRTGTNDQSGTRWCGSLANTGWSTACSSITEVPAAITNFSNPLPTKGDIVAGLGALPASFYLSSKPSWFGNVPFPAIGPDVAGGSAPNTSSTPTGGHANKIPARVCYESLANDPAYSGSSPAIKSFNATTCYGGGSSATQPTPPSGLQAVVL